MRDRWVARFFVTTGCREESCRKPPGQCSQRDGRAITPFLRTSHAAIIHISRKRSSSYCRCNHYRSRHNGRVSYRANETRMRATRVEFMARISERRVVQQNWQFPRGGPDYYSTIGIVNKIARILAGSAPTLIIQSRRGSVGVEFSRARTKFEISEDEEAENSAGGGARGDVGGGTPPRPRNNNSGDNVSRQIAQSVNQHKHR